MLFGSYLLSVLVFAIGVWSSVHILNGQASTILQNVMFVLIILSIILIALLQMWSTPRYARECKKAIGTKCSEEDLSKLPDYRKMRFAYETVTWSIRSLNILSGIMTIVLLMVKFILIK